MVKEFTQNIEGGIGAAITGYSLVDEYEKYAPLLPVYSDEFKESHQKLIAPFKKNNVPILIQLVYLSM
jgi:2,4-dienoyl-CoA reductase-like NADH-dependent reductase (Old Yellow Enzyme family)